MTQYYQKTDINTQRQAPERNASIWAKIVLISFLVTSPGLIYAQEVALSPYEATYTSTFKGMSAKLERSLQKDGSGTWSLSNKTSIFFSKFIEASSFTVNDGKLRPLSYEFINPMSKKRNSTLQFDWENAVVKELAKEKTPLKLPENALDKLSFQPQLRLDLMQQKDSFKPSTYQLVDSNKLKNYTMEYLGEETVETKAGTFEAVKMKRFRPGKDKHMIIWMAKNHGYFIIQIERFEKEKSRYKLELLSATIDGKLMSPATSTVAARK